MMPPPALPRDSAATSVSAHRRRNRAEQSRSPASPAGLPTELEADDSFCGFSDDDAFLASVDLEDLGPPVYEDGGPPIAQESDFGQPLDYPEQSEESMSVSVPQINQQNKQPGTSGSSSGRMSRLEAIIAAQMESHQENNAVSGSGSGPSCAGPSRITLPPQPARNSPTGNESRDLTAVQQKKSPPPAGGFHFPPGVNPNLGKPPQAGIKRPLEAIQAGIAANRGMRPGMGLQNQTGMLDVGEGGDIKMMRR